MTSSIPSISLIGMAGAGKTTIGSSLATLLNYSFIDSDKLLEESQGLSLQDILEKHGYQGLRSIEAEVILSIHLNNTVLATGGSIVYSSEAMDHLKASSKIIFLSIDFAEITKRSIDFTNRGFAKHPDQSVEEAYNERQALYKKYADYIVSNQSSKEECLEAIMNLLT